jgi:hypothetical protein
MTDAGDVQDQAEALDPDVLAEDAAAYDDPERDYPPEHLLGARTYGTTPAEERVDEPLDERLRRDETGTFEEMVEPAPEDLLAIEEEDFRFDEDLAEPPGDEDFDEDLDDDLDAEIARERPIGRLIGPGGEDDAFDFEDDEADAVAWRADDDDDDLSAEEEAVHLTVDPPYGEPGDGYIDEDDVE